MIGAESLFGRAPARSSAEQKISAVLPSHTCMCVVRAGLSSVLQKATLIHHSELNQVPPDFELEGVVNLKGSIQVFSIIVERSVRSYFALSADVALI